MASLMGLCVARWTPNRMSALGQKQTSHPAQPNDCYAPEADISVSYSSTKHQSDCILDAPEAYRAGTVIAGRH